MSSKIMFTELRRVWSNGYMHYIPEFEETFPELVRLSMPFAFITFIIMLITSPIHFFITGRWEYRLKSNGKLMNWFNAVGF